MVPIASSSKGNSILVGGDLLLDAGVHVQSIRNVVGFRVTSLVGCLLTHEHSDHARGVSGLLKLGVTVYASRGTVEALDLWHHRLVAIDSDWQGVVGGWSVQAFPVRHDAAEPLAFSATRGGIRVLYVTDTATLPFLGDQLPFTHVLIEANHRASDLVWHIEAGDSRATRVAANHMSIEAALKSLEAIPMVPDAQVWLTHMSNRYGNAREFAGEVLSRRRDAGIVRVAPEVGTLDPHD